MFAALATIIVALVAVGIICAGILHRHSLPESSNIVMAAMISEAKRLRAAPGPRRWSRCIKFYIRFQGFQGAVPVWLARRHHSRP